MRKLNNREKFLLGVVLIVAAVGLYYQVGRGGLGFGAEATVAASSIPPVGDPPIVRMDLLARGAADYDPSGRDLFKYYVPPPEPVVRKPKPKPPPRVARKLPQPPPPAPPRKPAAPQPPSPNFKYLGFLGPKESKIAFFDSGKELMDARVGDTVDEKFKLLEFRYSAVLLGYVDEQFKDRTTELKMGAK